MIYLASPAQVTIVPASVAAKIRGSLPAGYQFMDPLSIPAEADVIDLVAIAHPNTPWPRQMRNTTHPTVLLIGDDPGHPDGLGGPNAWLCSTKIGQWAEAVIVHGSGGDAQHYRFAASAAQTFKRIAFIESTAMHALAWAERISCPRTLTILPPDGLHPVQHRGAVH